MNMFRLTGCGLLCTLAITAQEPLTEERAVRLAVEQDLQLTSLRHGVRAAGLAPSGAGLISSPQIRMGVREVAPDLNDPAYTRVNAGLAWTPPKIGAFSQAVQANKWRSREASAGLAVAKARTEAEMRVLYRTTVLLDEQYRLAGEAVRLRERVLAAVSEQLRAGLSTEADRDAAELALAEARVSASQIRSEKLTHIVRIASRTGLAPSMIAITAPPDTLDFTAPVIDPGKLRDQALEAREEVRGAQARCELLALDLATAKRDLYPWFSSLQLFRTSARVSGARDWAYQIAVEVPVFRWKENEMPAIRERLEACRTSVLAVRAAVTREIDELAARMRAAAEDIEQNRRALTGLGARQLASAQARLAVHQADLVEPLLAEIRALSFRQAYTARLLEFRVLEAGLRQALGN